jgi:hypothetical protein
MTIVVEKEANLGYFSNSVVVQMNKVEDKVPDITYKTTYRILSGLRGFDDPTIFHGDVIDPDMIEIKFDTVTVMVGKESTEIFELFGKDIFEFTNTQIEDIISIIFQLGIPSVACTVV